MESEVHMTGSNKHAAPSLRDAQRNLAQAREDFAAKCDALRGTFMAQSVMRWPLPVKLGAVFIVGYGLVRLFSYRRARLAKKKWYDKWYKKGRKMYGRYRK